MSNRRWMFCLTPRDVDAIDAIVRGRFADVLRPSRSDAVRLAIAEQGRLCLVPARRRRLRALAQEVALEPVGKRRPRPPKGGAPAAPATPLVRWHQVYQDEHFEAMRLIQEAYGFASLAEAVRFALRATASQL